MYCYKCGNEVNEQARFCRHCGAPVRKAIPAAEAVEPADSTAVIDNSVDQMVAQEEAGQIPVQPVLPEEESVQSEQAETIQETGPKDLPASLPPKPVTENARSAGSRTTVPDVPEKQPFSFETLKKGFMTGVDDLHHGDSQERKLRLFTLGMYALALVAMFLPYAVISSNACSRGVPYIFRSSGWLELLLILFGAATVVYRNRILTIVGSILPTLLLLTVTILLLGNAAGTTGIFNVYISFSFGIGCYLMLIGCIGALTGSILLCRQKN